VYHALESEHAVVQERALGVVPGLCDTIDYAEVQGVLFPRVALVFTKTRILSVKVSTLVCFTSANTCYKDKSGSNDAQVW
jgi:SCY1-like protein 2